MNDKYFKDFDGWLPLKKSLDEEGKYPTFRQREIWWCSTGVNIGVEQDGHNDLFERPVLIVRKFNSRHFLGVPLTTKLKDFPHFHSVYFKAKTDTGSRERKAILSQIRSYDSMRLSRLMARLGEKQFTDLMKDLLKMLGQ